MQRPFLTGCQILPVKLPACQYPATQEGGVNSDITGSALDLYPLRLRDNIDRLNERLLFITLVRFGLSCYGLFKCNRNLLAQMAVLSGYTTRTRAFPGIDDTVDAKHIKTGYYSVKALNPTGIVPAGPEANGRENRA